MSRQQSAGRSMCLLPPHLGGTRPPCPCQVAVACSSPSPLTSVFQAGCNWSDWNCTMLHVWRQVGACRGIACCFAGAALLARAVLADVPCAVPAALLFTKRHAGAAGQAWALPAQLLRAVPAASCTANIIDSCRFSRVLHDPAVPPADRLTRAVYTDAKRQQTTLNHFHEKLLHIKVLLNACSCCSFAWKAAVQLACSPFHTKWEYRQHMSNPPTAASIIQAGPLVFRT